MDPNNPIPSSNSQSTIPGFSPVPNSAQVSDNQPVTMMPENSPAIKPKIAKTLSTLLFIMAAISTPAAFTGSVMVMILNKALAGEMFLEYYMLKSMPYIGFIFLPSIVSLPLIIYCALRLRVGSQKAWKTVMIILALIFLMNIITGFLTVYYLNPIYKATSNF